MTDREKELVNRYVYEVTKRIPKEQRNEIEMELRELIEDMAEGAPLEEVFVKLGDPAVFARKYREDKNYVISPECLGDEDSNCMHMGRAAYRHGGEMLY